jgi:5,10-methylenetetrahydrofolate reductase
LSPAHPVVFYEVIPPALGPQTELQSRLELIREVTSQVDAINIPEIRQETRRGARKLQERMEPRAFAKAIAAVSNVETVINRVTVHESAADQRQWLRDGYEGFGIRNLILVGGESAEQDYLGPSVLEMAALAAEENAGFLLGGITIAHRPGEAARVRSKHRCGLRFFTTQVLLDSKDITQLVQELEALPIRILLSFTPVSNSKDLDFLEWLGVEIPRPFRELVQKASSQQDAVDKSIHWARRILAEVLGSRNSRSPAIGLQVERITKRNSAAARRMLAELGEAYRRMLASHSPAAAVRLAPL